MRKQQLVTGCWEQLLLEYEVELGVERKCGKRKGGKRTRWKKYNNRWE